MLHEAIVASREKSTHGVCLVTTRLIRVGELVWRLDDPTYTWKEVESWSPERREAFGDCGSPRCRGTISNRDHRDPEWQAQDGPNLPPHTLAAIEKSRC